MANQFQELFLESRVASGYNKLLIGETELDKLAFVYYADLFYNIGCKGRDKSNILDIGSGPGHLGVEIAKRIIKGNVYFLDISPEMIERTKENVNQRFSNNKKINFNYIVDDAVNLLNHIKKGSIDLVIARHLVQIPEDPERILKQAYEALKPNGKFIFTLIGYNTFNFSDDKNSLFENKFFSRLAHASFWILPQYLKKLSKDALSYLTKNEILDAYNNLRSEALYPKHSRKTINEKLTNAGVSSSQVSYLILPETHTISFKLGYSLVLGSVPIPGIWNIFPLFDRITRYELVQKIYDKAFPGDKQLPIQTHDPIFIITKPN